MSEQEEQPRPSLRLRKTPDRPPAAPPEPPKAPEPKPASEEKAAETPRLRLSSMIRPGSGDTAAAPPAPPAPPPPAPVVPTPPPAPPTPPAAPPAPPEPVAKAEPEPLPEPAPPPEPVVPVAKAPEAHPPPPAPPPPVAKPADRGLPIVEEPRALQFPEEETPREAPGSGPKAPSPRALGLAILGVLIVVVGAVAYLLFMDPLGFFKKSEPETPPAAVSTPAPKPAPTTTPPATAQPAPVESAQTPAPQPAATAGADKEFKMPAPAPLQGGEEIAPGVVRLPRDASSVSSTPEPLEEAKPYEAPAPKQNPAYVSLVNNLNITGIRANDNGGFLMVNGALYRPGDIVDQQNKLVFVGIDGPTIAFKDPFGATYTRRF